MLIILPSFLLALGTDTDRKSVWLHSAILDIFRPFIGPTNTTAFELKTFSSGISSPVIVRDASLEQLKRLIVIYRFNYRPSTYSMVWHTALLYVANAMLQQTDKEDWLIYLLLCLYGYEGLGKSFRVAEAMARGLLSMAMRNGHLSGDHSRRIMADFQRRKLWDHVKGEIRATCMLDLDLAMSQPYAATAEKLAGDFEENLTLATYTNLFDVEETTAERN